MLTANKTFESGKIPSRKGYRKYYTVGPKIWILFSNGKILHLTRENKIHTLKPACKFVFTVYRHAIFIWLLLGLCFCHATLIDWLYNNFVIQSKLKPNKLWQAPTKRSQHFNTAYRNIVGCNMMQAFGHPVARCYDMLGIAGSNLKMVKFFMEHSWMLHNVVVVWTGSCNNVASGLCIISIQETWSGTETVSARHF